MGLQKSEKPGLLHDELAFCGALETNESAVQVLGNKNCAGSPTSWS